MPSSIAFDDRKFKELLLHIAERSVDDARFGKTKLNKILFYIDFLAYQNLGSPVTGASYQRRPMGPVPKEIAATRAALEASEEARASFVPYMGYSQERVVALRSANLDVFTSQELEIINNVIDTLWAQTGTAVSELSHKEPGWLLANERDTIPYESVFIGNREMTAGDIEGGQRLWAELQGATA